MKIAGLLWMSVTMSVMLLDSGSCVIEEDRLDEMVDVIWTECNPGKMFSIAASVPNIENQVDKYDFNQVLNPMNAMTVKNAILGGEVYKTGRIVAATFITKPDNKGNTHAEYRVLQNFDNLRNQQFDFENDLMLFYVLAAPCTQKCTNEKHPEGIIAYLENLTKWKNVAFAFSYLYKPKFSPKPISDQERRTGIKTLGRKLGLKNVFRCTKKGKKMQCHTCAEGNKVANICFSD